MSLFVICEVLLNTSHQQICRIPSFETMCTTQFLDYVCISCPPHIGVIDYSLECCICVNRDLINPDVLRRMVPPLLHERKDPTMQ